jgi:hypothetical protein
VHVNVRAAEEAKGFITLNVANNEQRTVTTAPMVSMKHVHPYLLMSSRMLNNEHLPDKDQKGSKSGASRCDHVEGRS